MLLSYAIYDVSAEFIMDVAKVISSAPYPLNKNDVKESFDRSNVYINSAINQGFQLGLIKINDNDEFFSSEKYSSLIKQSIRSQHPIQFRSALQKYPPFLLYVDFISKGYSSKESANIVKGILRIKTAVKIIEKSLKNWGKYAELIIEEKNSVMIPEAKDGLPSEYVTNLLKALQAELQASIFLIETMSPQAYAYLSQKNVGIENFTQSLLIYEKNPKHSANLSCQTYEHFLFKLGEDARIDVSKCNGIGQLTSELRSNNTILKNHMHLSNAVGALRNMAHHDPDKETGKLWNFSPQGGIITALLIPTMIRSIYGYFTQKKQDF